MHPAKCVGRIGVNPWSGQRLTEMAGVKVITLVMQVSAMRGTEAPHLTTTQSVFCLCNIASLLIRLNVT